MANDNSRPDVAVFIDFENVYVSVRDKLDANPDFEAIMDRCSELGRVVISRAYADWYRYPRVTSALYANGVEPMYVPTYYYDKDMGRTGRAIKNSADMNMCIDAMKTLFTNTNIAKFVLVTGDRDFIPLVNMIRQQGKDVIIIGIGGAASAHLAQSADEFIFYEQLVGKTPAPMGREANRERQRTSERSRPVEVEPEAIVPTFTAPVAPVAPVVPVAPPPAPEVPAEADPFETLVEAVHLARKRGYVCTLGSLKLVMKELMGGDFKESRYKDLSGRPFVKFKDFVLDAERRGKVQIFTNGTINEVFLPGEDPYKLSQFTGEVKEETTEARAEPPVVVNGRQPAVAPAAPSEPAASNGRSRRRRRSRGGRQVGQQTAEGQGAAPELEELEEVEDVADEPLTEAEELIAALMPDDFFDPEVGTGELADAEIAEGEGLLIPDDLIELPGDLVHLPGDHYVSDDDLYDLDALDPLDQGELIELVEPVEEPAASAPEAQQPDEVELLAEAEEIDDTAAALVSELRQQEAEPVLEQASFTDVPAEPTPEVELAAHEQQASWEAPAEPTPEVELAAHEQEANWVAPAEQPAPEEHAAPAVTETAVIEPVEAEAASQDAEPQQLEAVQPQTEGSIEATPATDDDSEVEATTEAAEAIIFSDEEWQVFREMMTGFTRPVAFAQIFDALRALRQQQRLTRTNEQLRTLVKQAIHNGLLDRSGRGTRVYYRLAENA